MKKKTEFCEAVLSDEELKDSLLTELRRKKEELRQLIDGGVDLCLPRQERDCRTPSESTSAGVLRLADEYTVALEEKDEKPENSELEEQIYNLSVAIATHVKFNQEGNLLERLRMAVLPVEVAFKALLTQRIQDLIKYHELQLLMNTFFDFFEQISSGRNVDFTTAANLSGLPTGQFTSAMTVSHAIQLLLPFREASNLDFYPEEAVDLSDENLLGMVEEQLGTLADIVLQAQQPSTSN